MRNYRYGDLEEKLRRHDLLMPLDVLLVGATGTGKSSTINALFGSNKAKVGHGVDPETQHISSYHLHDYLRIHDSAGLGDGKEADLRHAKNITAELHRPFELDGMKYGLIDLVIVLLDGCKRDLGTAVGLLESVILKSIDAKRVIVAINQADMAMKGRYWNEKLNEPEPELKDFLEKQALSVKQRIKESTGLTIRKPVYYSASNNYNIEALLDHIVRHVPTQRRQINLSRTNLWGHSFLSS